MKRFVVSFVMLALVLTAGQFSSASSNELHDVLIGFVDLPDAAMINAFGGEVVREFTLIPVIQAMLPAQAINALENNPAIAYIEPNGRVQAHSQTIPWGVARIEAPQVHGSYTGSSIRVAIIDTGIQVDHPDLNTYGGYNFVSNNSNYDDDNGHGTHVAGTVAALDNNIGVLGVAPDVRLYGVKVLDGGGSGTFADVIAGIQWSANNNMHVANMSLGASSGSTALEDACDAAYNAGVLLVASAGNSGRPNGRGDTVGYPAKYDSVMAVAATDQNDNRPRWSSHGPAVEIAAPGVSIYSTYINGGYATMSGTSMAAPHVAGVAALVFQQNSNWGPAQVRQQLNSTAIPLGDSNLYGHGLVWAVGAVGMN